VAWVGWSWQVTLAFGLGVDPPVQASWPLWYWQLIVPLGGNGIPASEVRSASKPGPLQVIWLPWYPQVTVPFEPFGPVTLHTNWKFWNPQFTIGPGLEGELGLEGGAVVLGTHFFRDTSIHGFPCGVVFFGIHFDGDTSIHGFPCGAFLHCKLYFKDWPSTSSPRRSLS